MRFDSCHPAVRLFFFVSVILTACYFNQPVFLAIGWLCPFLYSVFLSGRRALRFDSALLILSGLFTVFYASVSHFGVTALAVNRVGNTITLEALLFGLSVAVRASAVLMWLFCLHEVVSSDQVIYLFGRISPRLSLFLSILLRMVPRLRIRRRCIDDAQRAVGMGAGEGNLFRRIRRRGRENSILLTWLNDSLIESAASMKCRGYSLPGRTAFSIYRFDYRDRIFVILMGSCLSVLAAGVLLDQTRILYRPEIIMNRITPASFLFYGAYAAFCLMPMIVRHHTERQFRRAAMRA